MKKITYEDEPMKWTSLEIAAVGNLITAIKQLKRINFSDDEIVGTLKIILEKEAKR